MKYNIGDVVWIARNKHQEHRVVCPDCLGTKHITLLLPSGEQENLECKTCWPGGYEPSAGFVLKTQYYTCAEPMTITGMEISLNKTTYHFYQWSCDDVFDTEDEAKKKAEEIRVGLEDESIKQFLHKKEDSRRSWAWNCTYYRRQIKDAKQQIAWAEERLLICKSKAKEPEQKP